MKWDGWVFASINQCLSPLDIKNCFKRINSAFRRSNHPGSLSALRWCVDNWWKASRFQPRHMSSTLYQHKLVLLILNQFFANYLLTHHFVRTGNKCARVKERFEVAVDLCRQIVPKYKRSKCELLQKCFQPHRDFDIGEKCFLDMFLGWQSKLFESLQTSDTRSTFI